MISIRLALLLAEPALGTRVPALDPVIHPMMRQCSLLAQAGRPRPGARGPGLMRDHPSPGLWTFNSKLTLVPGCEPGGRPILSRIPPRRPFSAGLTGTRRRRPAARSWTGGPGPVANFRAASAKGCHGGRPPLILSARSRLCYAAYDNWSMCWPDGKLLRAGLVWDFIGPHGPRSVASDPRGTPPSTSWEPAADLT